MPSSYTPSLRLTLPADGELVGTWGQTVNNGITKLEEAAIAGVANIALADANHVLTTANGAADEARNAVLQITGALTAQRDIIIPNATKTYIVRNSTTGGFGVQIKTAAGVGIVVGPNDATLVYCDGTNVGNGLSNFVQKAGDTMSGPLTINSGTFERPLVLNSTGPTGVYAGWARSGAIQGYVGAGPVMFGVAGTFGLRAVGDLSFATGDAAVERMRIDTAGNVGIGVAPQAAPYRLGVSGSILTYGDNRGLRVVNADATGAGYFVALAGLNGGVDIGSDNGPQIFTLQGSERMRISPTGNVGIGMTSPITKLHIGVSSTGSDGIYITQLNNNVTFSMGVNGAAAPVGSWVNSAVLEANPSDIGGSTIISSYRSPMIFHTGIREERMRIDTNGYVGIGTAAATPYAKLQVHGAGFVGAVNNVSQVAADSIAFSGNAPNSWSGITYQANGGGAAMLLGRGGGWDTYIKFYTNPSVQTPGYMTEVMSISEAGRVGIGVSSAVGMLDVYVAPLVAYPALQLNSYAAAANYVSTLLRMTGAPAQPTVYSLNCEVACFGDPNAIGYPIFRYSWKQAQYNHFNGVNCTIYESGQWGFAIAISNPSSAHLKSNWVYETGGLVDGLAGITDVGSFDFDLGPSQTSPGQRVLLRQVGVTAEALQAVMPDAVNDPNNDGTLHVTYGNAAMVACIALAKRLKALEAAVAAL